jgi:hypothetical protein
MIIEYGGNTLNVSVYNIPGLVEAKAENIQRNKLALQTAFSRSGNQVRMMSAILLKSFISINAI